MLHKNKWLLTKYKYKKIFDTPKIKKNPQIGIITWDGHECVSITLDMAVLLQ